MSFKKAMIASALVIGAFGATAAQAQSSGYYVGGSLGKSYYDLNKEVDQDLEDSGSHYSRELHKMDVKLFGGYDFNQNLAIEGGYVHRTKGTFGNSGQAMKIAYTAGSSSYFAAAKLSTAAVHGLSFFGKLGVTVNHTNLTGNLSVPNSQASFAASKTNFAPVFGIGLQYDVTKSIAVRGEIENFGKAGDKSFASLSSVSMGVVYKF